MKPAQGSISRLGRSWPEPKPKVWCLTNWATQAPLNLHLTWSIPRLMLIQEHSFSIAVSFPLLPCLIYSLYPEIFFCHILFLKYTLCFSFYCTLPPWLLILRLTSICNLCQFLKLDSSLSPQGLVPGLPSCPWFLFVSFSQSFLETPRPIQRLVQGWDSLATSVKLIPTPKNTMEKVNVHLGTRQLYFLSMF